MTEWQPIATAPDRQQVETKKNWNARSAPTDTWPVPRTAA